MRSTLSAMANARIKELEKDSSALAEIRGVWKRSGVNGVQVTLGGMELAIAEWEGVVADLARRTPTRYTALCRGNELEGDVLSCGPRS